MVTIDIEVLVIAILIFMTVVWLIYYFISKKIYSWRYKKKYHGIDKGKKAEEKRRTGIGVGRESVIAGRTSDYGGNTGQIRSDAGQGAAAERFNLQAADSDSSGKTGDSNGKTRRKFRNPFRRR